MFERGKKDGLYTGDLDERPAGRAVGTAPVNTGAAERGRECAVIGRSIKINGDLSGDEDIRIEGDVSGTIQLKNSSLTIGKEGKIKADVYAKSIAVDGTMEGDLYASERITIRMNARVAGNVTAPRISIEDGAKFKGSVEMDQDSVDKAVGVAPKPAKPNGADTSVRSDPKLSPPVTGTGTATVKEAVST